MTDFIHDILNDIFSRYFRLKPIRLMLFVTGKCNAKCTMCNIWKGHNNPELGLSDYEKFTADPILSNIKYVVITGGEACLRDDLVDIVRTIVKNIPKIKKITLATNGLNKNMVMEKVENICKILENRNISFTVQISFDALKEENDKIRGIKDATQKVTSTIAGINLLKETYPFIRIVCNCLIQPLNLQKLESIYTHFLKEKIDFFFTVVNFSGTYYNNLKNSNVQFNSQQKKAAADFLRKISRDVKNLGSINERDLGKRFLFFELAEMISGKTQTRGCPILRENMAIQYDGRIIPCNITESLYYGNATVANLSDIWACKKTYETMEKIKREYCSTCISTCGASPINVAQYYIKNVHKEVLLRLGSKKGLTGG